MVFIVSVGTILTDWSGSSGDHIENLRDERRCDSHQHNVVQTLGSKQAEHDYGKRNAGPCSLD